MEKNKIRYRHTGGGASKSRQTGSNRQPNKDCFLFVASASSDFAKEDEAENDKEQPVIHKFNIELVTLQVKAIKNLPVNLLNVQETVITDSYLLYQTHPKSSANEDIFYVLVTPPSQGSLLLTKSSSIDRQQKAKKLKAQDKFTQADLYSGHLKYKLSQKSYQPLDDSFDFVVQVIKYNYK